MTLAITGVTGKLGGAVAQLIANAGIPARHLARNPKRAPKLPAAQIYQASYDDRPETLDALKGVDTLFMVSASESPERLKQHFAFIDTAHEAGVKHIIYTSFYKASHDSVFTLARDHAATEAYIKSRGLSYTFLRDNFYLDFFIDLCLTYGEIRGPAGLGKVSAVLRSDVAEVAATILKKPEPWIGTSLDMTGPEDLSMTDIAEQLSMALGKKISYTPETVEEAYISRRAWKAAQWEYDSWVSTYTAIERGEQAGVSNDIETVLGRQPKSLTSYLQEGNLESDRS